MFSPLLATSYDLEGTVTITSHNSRQDYIGIVWSAPSVATRFVVQYQSDSSWYSLAPDLQGNQTSFFFTSCNIGSQGALFRVAALDGARRYFAPPMSTQETNENSFVIYIKHCYSYVSYNGVLSTGSTCPSFGDTTIDVSGTETLSYRISQNSLDILTPTSSFFVHDRDALSKITCSYALEELTCTATQESREDVESSSRPPRVNYTSLVSRFSLRSRNTINWSVYERRTRDAYDPDTKYSIGSIDVRIITFGYPLSPTNARWYVCLPPASPKLSPNGNLGVGSDTPPSDFGAPARTAIGAILGGTIGAIVIVVIAAAVFAVCFDKHHAPSL
jgi:hypothetical protein